jgi:hypothetical protein
MGAMAVVPLDEEAELAAETFANAGRGSSFRRVGRGISAIGV